MRARRLELIAATISGAVCLFSWLPVRTLHAEPDDAKARDAQESEETTRLIKAEQPNWKMWKGPGRERELSFESKSVLRWTNPGTGRIYGDLYLWTAGGRPEAVMSLFKAWDPPDGFHAEMHSLSLEAVEAERSGKTVWAPSKAGVTLREVPDAPKPAETAVRRLSQMRALALEFEAVLTDKRRNNSGERQALRLLTQPLYRYQRTDSELVDRALVDRTLVDGALFAFVLGTDPEVFLLLEARRSKETPRWQFGLARMNNDSLAVSHKEREVWRIQRAEVEYEERLHAPYILMRVPETP